MNKKILIILCFISAFEPIKAENAEHENILHIQYGGMWQQDQYLSPLLYSGQMVGLGNEWWQSFRKDTAENWRNVGTLDIMGAYTLSERKNNRILSLGVDAGWGALYQFKFKQLGLRVLIGPYIGFNILAKEHSSNVNKPYSMDLSLNSEVMAGLCYTFRGKKTGYRLQYLIRTNLIGIDYMPDYWQSYYEIVEGVPGKIRCAGMWNHRQLNHQLSLDMQFRHSTWRLGIKHEYLEYGQQTMAFSREEIQAIIGCIWHYRINPSKDVCIW